MEDLKKEFGERLSEIRKSKKLKQQDLQEMIDVPTVQMISNWENGHAFPSAAYLIILSKRLDVSLDYLLLGKENNTVSRKIDTYKDVGECILALINRGLFELGGYPCGNGKHVITLTTYDQKLYDFKKEFCNLVTASETLRPELFKQAIIDLLNKYDIPLKLKGNEQIKNE